MSPPNPPGWYADPQQRFAWRWFDGRAWTSQVSSGGQVMVDVTPVPRTRRAPVEARWVRAGAVIFALEMATLLVGFISVVTSEALSYPSAKRDYVCGGHEYELISNVTWLAWFVLLNLATALLVIWLLRGRGNIFLAVSSLMSVGAVMLLFPSWLAIGTAMDCGM